MVLKFREYLQFHWDKDDFIIGKNVIGANGKPDQDQPTPRGRDWRLEKFFNNIIYEKEILCFCSFTLSTNPTKIRYQVSKTCSDKDFITFGNIYKSWKYDRGFSENDSYIKALKMSKFCISPEGNGVDCFRTWDALYEKSIPIVMESKIMRRYQDLPILYTKNYTEITEDFLNDFYQKALDTEYDFSKLFKSYWKYKIGDSGLQKYITI